MTPEAIKTLPEAELRGWCREVFKYGTREPYPGEFDEIVKRAKALKIPLDSLPMGRGFAMKETSRNGRQPEPALDKRSCEGASAMPDNRVTLPYSDSASNHVREGAA